MYFDTHAHYDNEQFDEDRQVLLSNLPKNNISLVLNPGCDVETSEKAVGFAQEHPHVYAAVGFHPHEADSFETGALEKLRAWLRLPKVRAIGEIGLDFHYDFSPRARQIEVFRAQLELARELSVPVIIHDREAHGECMEILKDFPELRGVFHCYSGSAEMARELVALGFYLSFTGAITFKNARRALESIEAAPLERIMLETDSPYLAPVPNRGKRNDSRNLSHIAAVVADIKGVSLEEAARITTENGKRLFGIE